MLDIFKGKHIEDVDEFVIVEIFGDDMSLEFALDGVVQSLHVPFLSDQSQKGHLNVRYLLGHSLEVDLYCQLGAFVVFLGADSLG